LYVLEKISQKILIFGAGELGYAMLKLFSIVLLVMLA